MRTILRLSAIALALAAPLAAQAPAGEEKDMEVPVLTVSGSGPARVAPDEATVRLGVLAQAPTAREAQDQVNRSASAVLDAIRKLGVPAERIQTTGLSLNPQYAQGRTRPGAADHRLPGHQHRHRPARRPRQGRAGHRRRPRRRGQQPGRGRLRPAQRRRGAAAALADAVRSARSQGRGPGAGAEGAAGRDPRGGGGGRLDLAAAVALPGPAWPWRTRWRRRRSRRARWASRPASPSAGGSLPARATAPAMTAEEVVRLLGLAPHPEGGFYRETFRAAGTPDGGARRLDGHLLPAARRGRLGLAPDGRRRGLAPLRRGAAGAEPRGGRPRALDGPAGHGPRRRGAPAGGGARRRLAERPAAGRLDPRRLHRGAGLRLRRLRDGAVRLGAGRRLFAGPSSRSSRAGWCRRPWRRTSVQSSTSSALIFPTGCRRASS